MQDRTAKAKEGAQARPPWPRSTADDQRFAKLSSARPTVAVVVVVVVVVVVGVGGGGGGGVTWFLCRSRIAKIAKNRERRIPRERGRKTCAKSRVSRFRSKVA